MPIYKNHNNCILQPPWMKKRWYPYIFVHHWCWQCWYIQDSEDTEQQNCWPYLKQPERWHLQTPDDALPKTARTLTITRHLMMLLRFGPTKIRFLLWNTSELPSFLGHTRKRTLSKLMEQNTIDKMLMISPTFLPSVSVELKELCARQHLDKNPGDAMIPSLYCCRRFGYFLITSFWVFSRIHCISHQRFLCA